MAPTTFLVHRVLDLATAVTDHRLLRPMLFIPFIRITHLLIFALIRRRSIGHFFTMGIQILSQVILYLPKGLFFFECRPITSSCSTSSHEPSP